MAGYDVRRGHDDAAAGSLPNTLLGHLREVTVLASLYLLYCFTRVVGAHDIASARQRADDVLRFEGTVHLDVESRLNGAVTDMAWLAVPMDYWYAVLHYLVTPAALGWIYCRRRSSYSRCRNAIVISSALGLLGYFFFPTAPPRLMGEPYLDTLASYADLGWWTEHASAPSGLGGLTNELAAMPSLHVGWAVWVAWALHRHVRSRLGRLTLLAYPLITTAVVVGTGNHWLLDCLAGVLVVGLGIAGSNLTGRRSGPQVSRRRRPAP
jgi:PAP2 superfamily